ncbi:MAG: prolipoprotein diacylglyceryl transferase [Phycisphaerae bacterium]|nr:prolipoprotein diacylglyceryl transferase [Phycisphaerae bacterium]
MHPELFEIPFLHVSVKAYGTMMVIGFLAAVWLMRRLMKRSNQNPDFITNIAMYALVSGIIGARIFYVIHHRDLIDGFWDIFAVWRGGLEFLGGVLVGIVFLWSYLWKQKLPKRLYLDILAIGLMVGLGFGRIGCFLNGCCYGKCTNVPWAVQFPYASPVFYGQTHPDAARDRNEPLLNLPADYFDTEGCLKPFDALTEQQQQAAKKGPYRTLPVHPTQLYSSMNGFILAGILLLIWFKFGRKKPGVTLSLMLILYGITRFYLETLRDDNPFEHAWWAIYKGGTVSQNIGIYMLIAGAIMLTLFATRKSVSNS